MYKKLELWQKSVDFSEKIYHISKSFPPVETYGLTSQIRRARISIPSNIEEGASRRSKKEFTHFLYITLGSLSEVETQLIIASRLKFVENIDNIIDELTALKKMTNKLISSLKASDQKNLTLKTRN